MFKKILVVTAGVAAATAMAAAPALATVTFDATTGTGFVGKGDVQLALGYNNQQVQAATLTFTYTATTVQETSWTCVNARNEKTQERAHTTTTEVAGVVTAAARVKNQITGFNLTGFAEGTTSTTETEGPKLESCPNANSGFVLGTTVIGEPVTTIGGLFVNGVLLS